jgi:hypothetical protein
MTKSPLDDDLTRRFFDILHGDMSVSVGTDADHLYVSLAERLAAEVEKARSEPTRVVMNVYGTPEDLAAAIQEQVAGRIWAVPPKRCPVEAGVADQLEGCELEAGHTGLHRYLGYIDTSTEA